MAENEWRRTGKVTYIPTCSLFVNYIFLQQVIVCCYLLVQHLIYFTFKRLILSLCFALKGFPAAIMWGISNQEGHQSVQEVDPAGEAHLHDWAWQN